MADETFDHRANGEIRIAWPGVDLSLRRPTFGEHRKLRDAVVGEQMEELADARRLGATIAYQQMNRTQRREYGAIPGGELEHEEFYERQAKREERRVRWWLDTVIPTLVDGAPALTMDDVPAFLANPELVTATMEHWRSRPQVPGAA